jgi:hypothetical protein
MIQIAAERDLTSIGCLASQLQRPMRAIERAVLALEIIPSMRINHVVHFNGQQVERIRAHLERGNR